MSATPISVPVSVIWTVRSTGQSAEATPATPLQVSVAQVHIGLKGAQGPQGLQGLRGYKGDKGDKGDTGDVTPEAEAARDAAEAARDAAEAAALTVEDAANLRTDLLAVVAGAGTEMIGFGAAGRHLGHNIYSRTIESFGITGTTDDAAVIQSAVNWCAANNILLTCMLPMYTIGAGITIPDDFRCDLREAFFVRKSGPVVFDMWANAGGASGNTGLDIRNVRFDGRRQADGLTKANVAHRFCGLRLRRCSGYLENVRADNTVNGEIQAEGNRGGIMLEDSVNIVGFRLFSSGTDGSGVFVHTGINKIAWVLTDNNTGSGFTSYAAADNEFHHISSDGSGYSGVSLNGARIRASWIVGKNAAIGYADVNIGHSSPGNGCEDAEIHHVISRGALGSGIGVNGSPRIRGRGWRCEGAAQGALLFIESSPEADIEFYGRGSLLGNGVTVQNSVGKHYLSLDIADTYSNGLLAQTAGVVVQLNEASRFSRTCLIGGATFAGAVTANTGATVYVRGEIRDSSRNGVLSAGAGSLAVLDGVDVRGSVGSNLLTASGGVIDRMAYRLSADSKFGTFTATAGATVTTIPNGNADVISRIRVWPTNAAAVAKQPFVNTLTAGVSFNVTLPSAAAGTETYAYEIS